MKIAEKYKNLHKECSKYPEIILSSKVKEKPIKNTHYGKFFR